MNVIFLYLDTLALEAELEHRIAEEEEPDNDNDREDAA